MLFVTLQYQSVTGDDSVMMLLFSYVTLTKGSTNNESEKRLLRPRRLIF